jgi:hypothetical protein
MVQPLAVTRAPRILGILSIVFASIVLFGSFFSSLGLLVPALLKHAPPPTSDKDAAAMAMLSHLYTAMGVVGLILLVMSIALLVIGIGELRYRRWAAVWSVRWGVVALGATIVMAILTSTMFGSGFFEGLATANPNADAAAARTAGRFIGIVYGAMCVLFYAPYPILLMVFFSRPHVRAAMTT